jgi:cell division protein FtsI/penicillin-binding protein 2
MKDPFINRKYVIMALIVLAALGLLVRLFIIQVVKTHTDFQLIIMC